MPSIHYIPLDEKRAQVEFFDIFGEGSQLGLEVDRVIEKSANVIMIGTSKESGMVEMYASVIGIRVSGLELSLPVSQPELVREFMGKLGDSSQSVEVTDESKGGKKRASRGKRSTRRKAKHSRS